MAKVSFLGFHGTNSAHVESILATNFNLSKGDGEWLGDGAYFFINDIFPKPENNATKWSISRAWDKKLKVYTYRDYSVLQCSIEVEEEYFLDLTSSDGIEIFNYLRNKYIEIIEKGGKRLKRGSDFKDGHIINDARMNLKHRFDVVKGRFYIKFAKESIFNIPFRIPNSSIIAVYNINENIPLSSIKIIKQKSF